MEICKINLSSKRAKRMNQHQLNLIAEKLKLSPERVKAANLVLIDGLNPYQAEKAVYGRPTTTIMKLVKSIQAESEYCEQYSQLRDDTHTIEVIEKWVKKNANHAEDW